MSDAEIEYAHPGYQWLGRSACSKLPTTEARRFAVPAGQMLPETLRRVCLVACPVARECVMHAYLGGPGGGRISGPIHFAALSARQRSEMTLPEALEMIARAQRALSAAIEE